MTETQASIVCCVALYFVAILLSALSVISASTFQHPRARDENSTDKYRHMSLSFQWDFVFCQMLFSLLPRFEMGKNFFVLLFIVENSIFFWKSFVRSLLGLFQHVLFIQGFVLLLLSFTHRWITKGCEIQRWVGKEHSRSLSWKICLKTKFFKEAFPLAKETGELKKRFREGREALDKWQAKLLSWNCKLNPCY